MKKRLFLVCLLVVSGAFIYEGAIAKTSIASETENMKKERSIIFLHHSTGNNILKGGVGKIPYKIFKKGNLEKWFEEYNQKNGTAYSFKHTTFPQRDPYGWNNYPYDYYNIWVKNGGDQPYRGEPTLEMLTKDYDTIIWKHCFPVSNIQSGSGVGDIDSSEKTLENYKLQYNALKEKMHQFPDTTFVVWTGAALVKDVTSEKEAQRMQEFVNWVINEWDEPGDNIFLWDFYNLETEGGLYLKAEYASGARNPHPNKSFAKTVAPYLGQRVVNILEGRGDTTPLTK